MKLTDSGDKNGVVLDMRRFLLSSSFMLVAVLAAGCGSDKQDSTADTIASDTPTVTVQPEVTETSVVDLPKPSYATQAPTPTAETPEFWLRTDRANTKSPGGYITAVVPEVPTYEGIQAIVRDVRAMKRHEQGGWFLSIDCGHSQDDTTGNRIANAKFAFDNLGAAQTGLTKFGQSVDVLPGVRCD
jgi:hypothetical protein